MGAPVYVTAWSNGQASASGSGYGLRIKIRDRERHFHPTWTNVVVELDGEATVVPLSGSFWRTCNELRSTAIGQWLLRYGLAPWPHRHPPTLTLQPLGDNRFKLDLHVPRHQQP